MSKLKDEDPNLVESIFLWMRDHAKPMANLCLDSRNICPGDIFFACYGKIFHGHCFIEEVRSMNAAAVLSEALEDCEWIEDISFGSFPILRVRNLREILGKIANRWYENPSSKLTVVAVTGTNGKTSCVQWIGKSLTESGRPCATIGTLGILLPNGVKILSSKELTTPDVLTMHCAMAFFQAQGIKYVAVEASSIGIDQGRLDQIHIRIACFTNLTHDHLDYHGTIGSYKKSKFCLFLGSDLEIAIVNADDIFGLNILRNKSIERNKKIKFIPYSISRIYKENWQLGLFAENISIKEREQYFTLSSAYGRVIVHARLIGVHNVSNFLLVAGVLQAVGIPLIEIKDRLSALEPVSGRLEFIDIEANLIGLKKKKSPLVVIDYAHTPDSLEKALKTLRPVSDSRNGKLRCLFGAGGERDSTKRPKMGQIALDLSDFFIVTSDNSRSENTGTIISEILNNIPLNKNVQIQPDRALAIMKIIWESSPEDVVLLAGRGNEIYQEINNQKLLLEDKQWAKLALVLPRINFGISVDTRSLIKGELFFALSGAKFNGHDYLKEAEKLGACAVVVEVFSNGISIPQIILGNTKNALMKIASAWRKNFSIPVIAVVGSNGKTTTKEMLSTIFKKRYGEAYCLANFGNFNNDIGVSLSLLKLRDQHQLAIFELGMNHPGEISILAKMVNPTISVITNAQREHLQFIRSAKVSAIENGKVIDSLSKNGTVICPSDDSYSEIWFSLCANFRKLSFGFSQNSDIYAKSIVIKSDKIQCKVAGSLIKEQNFNLPLLGLHNLRNALAAISAASVIGVDPSNSIKILSNFRGVSGRVEPKKIKYNNALLIDDTYNANPDSVIAAIDVLSSQLHPQVLVLGDLSELGKSAQLLYREIGSYAFSSGIDVLITFGKTSHIAALAFGSSSHTCSSISQIINILRSMNASSILVKGSRNMKMERVVNALSDIS